MPLVASGVQMSRCGHCHHRAKIDVQPIVEHNTCSNDDGKGGAESDIGVTDLVVAGLAQEHVEVVQRVVRLAEPADDGRPRAG
jgi:hypothetical protein